MVLLALEGCGPLPMDRGRVQADDVWAVQVFDEDAAYLVRLNERVKEGKLTPADRDYLWQAYLVRIQGTMAPRRVQQVRGAQDNYWSWPFVLPSF